VRVGMEASGQARWFERLLAELKMELWIGDAAEIRAKRVRKKKTDREDARHILRLLVEDRFPRIWVPSWENRDMRQLLWHRHRMVQMRTRIMNQLQAVALNESILPCGTSFLTCGEEVLGKSAKEWHFTLRERLRWTLMIFPSRRQLRESRHRPASRVIGGEPKAESCETAASDSLHRSDSSRCIDFVSSNGHQHSQLPKNMCLWARDKVILSPCRFNYLRFRG
jgi:hypothetical protein